MPGGIGMNIVERYPNGWQCRRAGLMIRESDLLAAPFGLLRHVLQPLVVRSQRAARFSPGGAGVVKLARVSCKAYSFDIRTLKLYGTFHEPNH